MPRHWTLWLAAMSLRLTTRAAANYSVLAFASHSLEIQVCSRVRTWRQVRTLLALKGSSRGGCSLICSILAWNESYDSRNCLIKHNFICYLHLKKGSTLHWWQNEDKYAEGLQQQQNYCSKIGIVWEYKVVCYHLIWEIMQNINVGTCYDSNNGCVIRCHYIIITLIILINHYYLLLLLINHYYLLLLE